MGIWFSHKSKDGVASRDARQDRLAERMVFSCIRWQVKWAGGMQSLASRLSLRGKIVALLLFCLLAGAWCLYLILQGFTG